MKNFLRRIIEGARGTSFKGTACWYLAGSTISVPVSYLLELAGLHFAASLLIPSFAYVVTTYVVDRDYYRNENQKKLDR